MTIKHALSIVLEMVEDTLASQRSRTMSCHQLNEQSNQSLAIKTLRQYEQDLLKEQFRG